MPHWLHTENASLDMNVFHLLLILHCMYDQYICQLYEQLCNWADQTNIYRCMTVYTVTDGNSPLTSSKFLMERSLNSNWISLQYMVTSLLCKVNDNFINGS